MSIRWIRKVEVDGQPTTLEVLLGWKAIADKCYVRIGQEEETWFRPSTEEREEVLNEGLRILKDRLGGHDVKESGRPYGWN